MGDADRHLLYVGCYTPDGGPGIHVLDAGAADGTLRPLGTHDGVADASYLAPGPAGDVLYAVSERTGRDGGDVVALRIEDADGSLTELDRVSSQGAGPCHVAVSADGRHLYVANYADGTMAAYGLRPDGAFAGLRSRHQHAGSGPRTDRQAGPHTHGVLPRPGGTLLVTDLGTDELLRYRHADPDGGGPLVLDATLAMPPGTGPRHAVPHPRDDALVLVVGELDATLTVVEDRPGAPLAAVASGPTLPAEVPATSSTTGAVVAHPDGQVVYVSNRGPDTVAVLTLPPDGGPTLRTAVPSGGRTPRDLLVHPSGRHLVVANQDGGRVTVLALDDDGVPVGVADEYALTAPAGLAHVELRP